MKYRAASKGRMVLRRALDHFRRRPDSFNENPFPVTAIVIIIIEPSVRTRENFPNFFNFFQLHGDIFFALNGEKEKEGGGGGGGEQDL